MKKNITYPYQNLQEYPVKNKVNLFQTGLQELTATRNMMNQARRLLQVSDQDTTISILGDNSEGIKITFKERKKLIAEIYYMPDLKRVDIYDEEGIIAAFERKNCIYTRCSEALIRFGMLNIFKQIVSFT